jgi:transposase
MTSRKRYPEEVRDSAVRLVRDQEKEHGSQWGAIRSVAEKIGCSGETLPGWVREAERNEGLRPAYDRRPAEAQGAGA